MDAGPPVAEDRGKMAAGVSYARNIERQGAAAASLETKGRYDVSPRSPSPLQKVGDRCLPMALASAGGEITGGAGTAWLLISPDPNGGELIG